ncbi:hypothetical protein BpHYR1_003778 [Brachionus plicatilis]|uniref:Uncharacterized protein n=1 Tax=Brachionus plicatilis TaxID=10195 RepID=A0A3M7RSA4_BRAPC|nr:hypothetical protein BpHYR1_003778 [Brachionus plicatilis]
MSIDGHPHENVIDHLYTFHDSPTLTKLVYLSSNEIMFQFYVFELWYGIMVRGFEINAKLNIRMITELSLKLMVLVLAIHLLATSPQSSKDNSSTHISSTLSTSSSTELNMLLQKSDKLYRSLVLKILRVKAKSKLFSFRKIFDIRQNLTKFCTVRISFRFYYLKL